MATSAVPVKATIFVSDDEDVAPNKSGHPIDLRTKMLPPARFRDSEESDDLTGSTAARPAKRKRQSNSPQVARKGKRVSSTTTSTRRSKYFTGRKDSAVSSTASERPSRSIQTIVTTGTTGTTGPTKYLPAAFPTLDRQTLPQEDERSKHVRAIEGWVAEDERSGRWGDSWSEVGADAPQRWIQMALEGRAKRAFARGQMRTALWFRQEMALSGDLPVDDDTPRSGMVRRVLRTHWPNIARDVFGEEADKLRVHIREVDRTLNTGAILGEGKKKNA